MGYPTRIYYTEANKAIMWDRWQKGDSLNAIARSFGRSHSCVQGIFARTGGIRPAPKCRLSTSVSPNQHLLVVISESLAYHHDSSCSVYTADNRHDDISPSPLVLNAQILVR